MTDRLLEGGWIIALALALGCLAWDASARAQHILGLTAGYGMMVDPPAIDPSSPTGYDLGRRSIVLARGAADSSHWIIQTQEMLARGDWRVRRADYDGAPEGREVHWAAPLHWWLALLARIDHAISGRPIGIAVERATLLSGPLMLAIALPVIAVFLRARFSPSAAALFALGAVASFPFYIDFLPGRADHHGLANLCALLAVLSVTAGAVSGSVTASTATNARRWFAASAAAGGVGLWISAATLTPVLFALSVGLAVAIWLGRKESCGIVWLHDPAVFRVWSLVGGSVSLAAYAIEYVPGHLGWRLEVNHPLYALAWMGAGELLRSLSRFVSGDSHREVWARERLAIALAVAAVLTLPVVIALTARRTFTVSDPFIWTIHVRSIAEFQGVFRHLFSPGVNWSWAALCLPAALLVAPVVCLFSRRIAPMERLPCAITGVPAVVTWLMAGGQVRWTGLAVALTFPALAVFLRVVERRTAAHPGRAPLWWAVAGAVVFAPGMVTMVKRTLGADEVTREEIQHLAERDVAHRLRLRVGDDPTIVASAPGSTTRLIFWGGHAGVGTLYWENAAGLHHAAELFAAPSPAAAREIVRELGISHIVFFSWDAFEIGLAKLARGLPDGTAVPKDTFIAHLLGARVPPPWLQSIGIALPEHTSLEGAEARVWEVVDEMSPRDALVRAAHAQLEAGRLDRAEHFVPELTRLTDHLPAQIALARIAARRRDASAFVAALERALTVLPQASSLAPADRIALVVALMSGSQVELARAQLRDCVRRLDEPALRRLPPDALVNLLSLCDSLDVAMPDQRLADLASRLIPPMLRP